MTLEEVKEKLENNSFFNYSQLEKFLIDNNFLYFISYFKEYNYIYFFCFQRFLLFCVLLNNKSFFY